MRGHAEGRCGGLRWPRRCWRYLRGVLSGGRGLCPGTEVFGAGVPWEEAFQCRAGERFAAVAAAFVEVCGQAGQDVQPGHLGGGGDGPDGGGVPGGVPVMGAAGVLPGDGGASDRSAPRGYCPAR